MNEIKGDYFGTTKRIIEQLKRGDCIKFHVAWLDRFLSSLVQKDMKRVKYVQEGADALLEYI